MKTLELTTRIPNFLERAQPEKPSKINNTALLAETGLRVVHIRPGHRRYPYAHQLGNFGMTIAFREHRRTIEIATAVCHRTDTFCKKVGTKTAVEHFQAGRTIHIPYHHKDGAIITILDLFEA